jgi:hypothetical protein
MRTMQIALVLLFGAFPLPCHSQFTWEQTGDTLSSEVVNQERLAWERTKQKDKAGLAELLSQDFTEITDDGVLDKSQVLANLDHLTLSRYSPTDLKVKKIAPDAVLLVYQVIVNGKYDDHNFKNHTNAASLWMKRAGKWQNVLFQETPVPKG